MKTPSNIEYFNLLTGFIFSRLYLSFPIPITLERKDIMYFIDLPKDFDEQEFFYRSIKWLAENGYISHHTKELQKDYFKYTVLTSKGFSVLNSIPEIICGSNTDSIGDKIAKSVDIGEHEGIRSAVRYVFAYGIGIS